MKYSLILNADFTPLTACNWKKSFSLVFLKKVELVRYYEQPIIDSKGVFHVRPAVVRVYKYVRVKFLDRSRMSKKLILARDDFKCVYCGVKTDLTYDHVIPKSRWRSTDNVDGWNNLVVACKKCNFLKGDKTPDEIGFAMKKLSRPNSKLLILAKLGDIDIPKEWKDFI